MPAPALSVPDAAARGRVAPEAQARLSSAALEAPPFEFQAAFPSHTALGCGLLYRFGNSFDQLNARVTLNGTDDTSANGPLHRCLGPTC